MERKDDKQQHKEEEINPIRLNTLATRIVYWLFEAIIVSTMIATIVLLATGKDTRETGIPHILLCALALVLYNVPSFVQWRFRIYVPSAIHIFVLVFITAHFVLGEVARVYQQSAWFDKILHATSGVAIALIGFSLVNIFNTSSNTHLKLSPFFVAFFSFCFALAIAALWEIFEYAVDSLFSTNMQRYIPPDDIKHAMEMQQIDKPQGYGLIDTMSDMIVSTISAFVVCVLGYFSLRSKRNLMNRFLLRKIPDFDTAIAEAEEAGDDKLAAALKKAREAAVEELRVQHGCKRPEEDPPPVPHSEEEAAVTDEPEPPAEEPSADAPPSGEESGGEDDAEKRIEE